MTQDVIAGGLVLPESGLGVTLEDRDAQRQLLQLRRPSGAVKRAFYLPAGPEGIAQAGDLVDRAARCVQSGVGDRYDLPVVARWYLRLWARAVWWADTLQVTDDTSTISAGSVQLAQTRHRYTTVFAALKGWWSPSVGLLNIRSLSTDGSFTQRGRRINLSLFKLSVRDAETLAKGLEAGRGASKIS